MPAKEATRIQRIIIEEYKRLRTVPRVVEAMGYKSPSFVRGVIHAYKLSLIQVPPEYGRYSLTVLEVSE